MVVLRAMNSQWVRQIPWLSLGMAGVSLLLLLLPLDLREALYYDSAALGNDQYWGLISGHWMHVDRQHALWNAAALAILGSTIERRSRGQLFGALLFGILGVDLLLVSPMGTVQRYCGLSGVLNTLLGVVLWLYWRETRSRLVPLIGILCTIKIAVEMQLGGALLTSPGWPPFAHAHLAGLLSAPFAIFTWRQVSCSAGNPLLRFRKAPLPPPRGQITRS